MGPLKPLRPLLAQLRLDLTLTLRNGESLLLTLGIPVLLLGFFSSVEILPIDGEAVDFLAPGVLALAVLSTAFTNLAIAVGFERSYGVLKRLGGTPLGRPRLVVAKSLVVLAVLGLQVAVLVAAAVALGWEPTVRPLPATAIVVLGAVAFTGLALALAGRLAALTTLAAANALFLAMLLLSGMVFPLEELPAGLRTFAELLPSTALADGLRGALTGEAEIPGRVWPVLAVWAVAGIGLGVTLFHWEPDP